MRRVAILTKAVTDDAGKVLTPEISVVPSYDELDDSLTKLGVFDKYKTEIADRPLTSLEVVATPPFVRMT